MPPLPLLAIFQKKPGTIPIAIYSLLQQPDGESMAMRLVILSLILAFSALIANYWIMQKYQRKLEG